MLLFLVQRLHLSIFKFTAFNNIVYSIYLPAGARLFAVIVFDFLGALGVLVGWILMGLFTQEHPIIECFYIGISSGISCYLAYQIWLKLFGLSSVMESMDGRALLYLVLIVVIVTAPFRMIYFYLYDWPIDLTILIVSFVGDLMGCLVLILTLKFGYFLYHQFSR